METDATLLAPRPSRAPRSFRSLGSAPHSVGSSFKHPIRLLDGPLAYSEDPAWKLLISHTPAKEERISLITAIFLDDDQAQMVEHLSGNDAQAFIDVIGGVSPHGSIDFDLNLHIAD